MGGMGSHGAAVLRPLPLGLAGAGALAAFAVLAVSAPTAWFLLYGAVFAGVVGLALYARPQAFLLVLVAVMALHPDAHLNALGGMEGQSWYKLGLFAVLCAYAVRFGGRPGMNWPILAVLAMALLALSFGDHLPGLTAFQMVKSVFGVVVAFAVFSIAFRPVDIRRLIPVIALIPTASVLVGAMSALAGQGGLVVVDPISNVVRLSGATIPAYLALLSLTAFIASVNQAVLTRVGGWWWLAGWNLLILAGTLGRMALFLAVLYAGILFLLLPLGALDFRKRLAFLVAGVFAATVLGVVFWDALASRFLASGAPGSDQGDPLNFMGRLAYWDLGLRVFEVSPLFGRGFGAGVTFMLDVNFPGDIRAPHNEYLRFLIDGGVVGLALMLAGMALLAVGLARRRSYTVKVMIVGIFACLAIHSFTDNALSAAPAMVHFLYLALLAQGADGVLRQGAYSTVKDSPNPRGSAAA